MKWPATDRSSATMVLVLVLLVVFTVLATAACGGSGTTASTSPSVTPSDAAATPSAAPSTSATPLPTPTATGTIAFAKVVTAGSGGNSDIYVVNADGTGLRQLTNGLGWETHTFLVSGRNEDGLHRVQPRGR